MSVESTTKTTDKPTSVLGGLFSKLSVGSLRNVSMPVSILEPRSLLEMYADFLGHPDEFVSAAEQQSPRGRFLGVLKFYLKSFYCARKPDRVPKKPYNPILGETFRCRWTLPNGGPLSTRRTQRGPFPGSATNQLTFIAEQVSHHPPISAFYVEHPDAGVSCTTYICTKSNFTGWAVSAEMVGRATIRFHKYNEEYTTTFPTAYANNIFFNPWFELGGKADVRCRRTGFRAEITFVRKPLLGEEHGVTGRITDSTRQPVMTLSGKWAAKTYLRIDSSKTTTLFTNVRATDEVEKECDAVMQQGEKASRRLWRHLTAALTRGDIQLATQAKKFVEQLQRDEAQRNSQPQPHYFRRNERGQWIYKEPLENRMAEP